VLGVDAYLAKMSVVRDHPRLRYFIG